MSVKRVSPRNFLIFKMTKNLFQYMQARFGAFFFLFSFLFLGVFVFGTVHLREWITTACWCSTGPEPVAFSKALRLPDQHSPLTASGLAGVGRL